MTRFNSSSKSFIIALLVWLGSEVSACANAGTPLLWVATFHLLIGNALLGIGEGFVLGRLLRVPTARAMTVMMAANYFSAWIGGIFVRWTVFQSAQIDLNNGWQWFWGLTLAAYFLTLLLEWPFIRWLLRGRSDSLKSSVRSSFLIQTISCSLLFGCYWAAGDTSLYTRTSVVPPSEMSLPETVVVYYLHAEDGDVYRRPLRGGTPEKIRELSAMNSNDRLFVRANPTSQTEWDLMARLETSDRAKPKIVEVLPRLNANATPGPREEREPGRIPGSWFNFGKAVRLGNAKDSPWEFRTGFWAVEGVKATNAQEGERTWIAFETPFVEWHPRNAVHLPGDVVLFQLGRDQICVFDPKLEKVSLLWRGKGPVAVIPKAEVLRPMSDDADGIVENHQEL